MPTPKSTPIRQLLSILQRESDSRSRAELRKKIKGIKEFDLLEDLGLIDRIEEPPRIKEKISQLGIDFLKLCTMEYEPKEIIREGINSLTKKEKREVKEGSRIEK